MNALITWAFNVMQALVFALTLASLIRDHRRFRRFEREIEEDRRKHNEGMDRLEVEWQRELDAMRRRIGSRTMPRGKA